MFYPQVVPEFIYNLYSLGSDEINCMNFYLGYFRRATVGKNQKTAAQEYIFTSKLLLSLLFYLNLYFDGEKYTYPFLIKSANDNLKKSQQPNQK